jgi:hypothetical protein
VTTVKVVKIEETGPDYVLLRDGNSGVRINFAADSKEDSAIVLHRDGRK